MQETPRPTWYHSPVARIAVIVLALLVLGAVLAALIPVALQALAVAIACLTGFAICALPFATVFGIVYLCTRPSRRAATPTFAAATPGALATPPRPSPRTMNVPSAPPARMTNVLPPLLQAAAARIHDKATALRDPRQWALLSPEDQLEVDHVVDEYLPGLVHTYQAMPRGTQGWSVGDGGPNVLELVERQLRLLEAALDRIVERVFNAGAAQLLAQQTFLQDRLRGDQAGELQIGPR